MTEDLRINFDLIAKHKEYVLNNNQPVDDERFRPIKINWQHYARVLHRLKTGDQGNASITGYVSAAPRMKAPSLLGAIWSEIKYRWRRSQSKITPNPYYSQNTFKSQFKR